MVWTEMKQKRLRRGGKNTQKNYTKKIFMTQITMMVTHLEPDILECEVQWALRSITTNKASGVIEFQSNSQILKDDAMKLLHSICQQIWKAHHWPQNWQQSVFLPIPKKGNAKECSNYHTTALISHASKVVLKILQGKLQQYHELAVVQVGFRKGRETRD